MSVSWVGERNGQQQDADGMQRFSAPERLKHAGETCMSDAAKSSHIHPYAGKQTDAPAGRQGNGPAGPRQGSKKIAGDPRRWAIHEIKSGSVVVKWPLLESFFGPAGIDFSTISISSKMQTFLTASYDVLAEEGSSFDVQEELNDPVRPGALHAWEVSTSRAAKSQEETAGHEGTGGHERADPCAPGAW